VDNKPVEVLLIEDSVFAVKHTEKMLAEAKSAQFEARLECADRLSTGLERLTKGGVDIVLLDLTLPDSHELDTFTKVQTQAPEVPIVVLSGLEDETLAINAVQKGAQDYLIKGQVDSNLLKRSILYSIERKQAEEELKKHREHLEELVEERTAQLQQEITERKKAEEKIKAEKEFSEKLISTANAIIVGLDREHRIQLFSEGAERITGYKAEEVMGKDWFGLFFKKEMCPEMVKVWNDAWGKDLHSYTNPIYSKTGKEIIAQWSNTSIMNEKKEPILVLCIAVDITERKKAEEALSASEVRYRRLFESAKDGILILDAETGMIADVNPFLIEMLGFSHEQLLEKAIWEIGCFRDIASNKAKFMELQRQGYVRHEDLPLETADGRRVEVEFVSNVYTVNHQKVIQCNIRDITERKKAEEALSASEVRYRRLFESAKDGILILDAETGMIADVNPFLIEMLGFSHEQLLEKAIWEIGCFRDIASNKAKFMELQRQGYVRHEDLPLETTDGRRVEVEFVSNVYTVNHQKVIQCNIRDITERKRAEEKLRNTLLDLERSNKELQQFAYVASHDLQEPLRMVASYTQLLEKRYKDKLDSDANEFIQFAVDGAIRMQRLINDLLIYSRVGTRGKSFEPTDSHAVLGQAIANLSALIEENQAVVTNDDLPPIMVDESQMVQLFQNLIGNAIKFRGDQSPRIHVSAEQKGNEWVFSVKDNGIGIDPQFNERIFVVFKRLHQKEEYPGTGMGLAICKKIVERHGGRIWVKSELEKGSTFYFSIPVIGKSIEAQAVYEMA
jgi:PAS domain S-box-containing protein